MNTFKIILFTSVLVVFLAGCSKTVTTSGRQEAYPEAGSEISLTNCMADPSILKVEDGATVTFQNRDSQAHTILISGKEVALAPNGYATYLVQVPENVPANYDYTDNYLCDNQGSGALFIPGS